MGTTMTRRAVLTALAAAPLVTAPLAACSSSSSTGSVPTSSAASPSPGLDPRFVQLEERFGARLGVYGVDVVTGRAVAFRADERFAFCSTVKALAVGTLLKRNRITDLDRVAKYAGKDLVDHSPVTEKHVDTGMTLLDIAAAALRYSDNTAGNLLFRELGGPGQVQATLRGLGDTVTNVDRTEPTLNEAIPGDVRDTTTPLALVTSFQAFTLGDALPAKSQRLLNWWLDGNTTGGGPVRSIVPEGWRVGDKTGAGSYATRNDLAVIRPPGRGAVVLAVMSSKADMDAKYDDTLIAEAAKLAIPLLY